MRIQGKARGLWIAALMSLAGLASAGGDFRLAEAAKKGDIEAVRSLAKQHVDVNTRLGDGTTALVWAAHWNDVQTADLLIRAGANVDAASDLGVTALWEACVNASAGMVDRLLQAGANPNAALATGATPLMMCTRTGSLGAVKALLAKGADVNAKESRKWQTALMWAAAEKHPEIARLLIEYGADVHARSKAVVLPAAKSDDYSSGDGNYEGDFLPISKGGFTPLLFAAEHGDLDSVQMLLAAGADVNEATPDGSSALLRASANAHEGVAMYLLEHGANPNAADENGMTALHYSMLKGLMILRGVLYGNFDYLFRANMDELAKALLAHGANPAARITKGPEMPGYAHGDSPVGATPFLLAAATEDIAVMRALAALGADPNQGQENGITPLMMAAGMNQDRIRNPQGGDSLEAVKTVVELGGDVNAANDLGQTALHVAAAWGRNEMVQFLVDKGAKVNAKDMYGQTPWSLATFVGEYWNGAGSGKLRTESLPQIMFHKDTADLLIKLGATRVPSSGNKGLNAQKETPNVAGDQ